MEDTKIILFGSIFMSCSLVEIVTFKISNGKFSTGFGWGLLTILLVNNLID